MIGEFIGQDIGGVADTEFIEDGVGAATGVATVTATGATTHAGVASATGVATVAGIGASTHAGVGSSAGVATVTGVADAVKETVGASAGTSTCTAVGEQEGSGAANAAGVATVTADSSASSFDKLTDTVNHIQEPVDFWLPHTQTGVQGSPGQLNKALFRQVFNE